MQKVKPKKQKTKRKTSKNSNQVISNNRKFTTGLLLGYVIGKI